MKSFIGSCIEEGFLDHYVDCVAHGVKNGDRVMSAEDYATEFEIIVIRRIDDSVYVETGHADFDDVCADFIPYLVEKALSDYDFSGFGVEILKRVNAQLSE